MKILYTTFLSLIICLSSQAQLTPEVTSWIINTTGATGYGGYETNVQQVQYSTNNVYISCTCIPGYDIGPWNGNPNTPANQNFVYKITRSPQVNTGTLTNTPLGHIGVWTNGVSMFNARDAFSYNNQGVWNQNASIIAARKIFMPAISIFLIFGRITKKNKNPRSKRGFKQVIPLT